MNNVLFSRGEFRIIWLYLPVVALQAWLATRDVYIVDVYWDSVFYKQFAFGFADWHNFALKNHFPVPPLYPLILSLGVIPHNFMMTETVQSWINPALYYLSIYPIYLTARLFASERYSLLAVAVFLAYPTGVFAQWTLSENLAIPLSLACFYYVAKALIHDSYKTTDTCLLILFCSAALLTRIQSIFIVFPLLVWCIWRRWYNRQSIIGICCALTGSIAIWLLLLERLGYLASKADWFIYSNTNEEWKYTLWEYTGHFLNRFFSHWTALWIEGGLVIPSLLITALLLSTLKKMDTDHKLRELLWCWLFVSVCLVGAISLYRLTRLDVEPWSVSLRHIGYVNLWAIPLALCLVERLKSNPHKTVFIVAVISINILFSISLFMPDVWEGLTRPETYFSNAPTLDLLDQLKSLSPIQFCIVIVTLSILLAALILYKNHAGLICWMGLMLYLYGCSMDYLLGDRAYAYQRMGYRDMQSFCHQIEAGRWKTYHIYCVEDDLNQKIRPNLRYWLNQSGSILEPNAPKPKPPYLAVTFRDDQNGELVFQSGKLKAYLQK